VKFINIWIGWIFLLIFVFSLIVPWAFNQGWIGVAFAIVITWLFALATYYLGRWTARRIKSRF
jgi:hypothetical protein